MSKNSLNTFIQLCFEKRKFLVVFNGIILVSVVIITLLLPNWYKSTAVILPNVSGGSALSAMSIMSNLGIGGSFLGEGVADYNRYLAIVKSRTLKEKLARKYHLHEKYDNDFFEDTIKEIDDYLEAEVGDEMQIEISFLDKDQNLVAEMTNSIVSWLDSINIELSTQEARSNRKFVGSRFAMALDSIIALENEISDFMREQNVLDLQNQIIYGIEQASRMKSEILGKEVELYTAQKQYSKDNPIVKLLEIQIESLKKKYDEFFNQGTDNRLIPPFNAIPELNKKYLELQRKAEYNKRILEFLAPQYEQARIEEARTIPTIQILDTAERPERKSKPKRSIIVVVSLLLSGIISLYYLYWKEYILPGYPFLNRLKSKA